VLLSLLVTAVQAVQQGSVDALLSAAAATHNSMCGLYPLGVALEALYGSSSSSSSVGMPLAAAKPELLDYRAAHTIFDRPDSTGFAAFAVHAL
jgi:predicted class III extradiol MEMO1 family dioxygenase